MQKFEFSLERVLKARRQQEKQAEMEQLRAKAAVDQSRLKVQELKTQLEQLSHELTAFVGKTMMAHQWATNYDLSNHLGIAIAAAEGEVKKCEDLFNEASRHRAEVAAEVEALKTLRHQKFEEHRQEYLKYEQEMIEDAGLRKMMASISEGE